MRKFTLNRTAVLSIMAIAFLIGITSCAKSNLKKDINGGWALNSVTINGVDMYAQMGGSVSGVWIFDKKEKTCHVTTTFSSSFETSTETGIMSYTVKDKETIMLEGEAFTITELGSNNLVLSINANGESGEYHFTK